MAKLQLRKTMIWVWLFSIVVLIVPIFIGAGLTLQLGTNDFQERIISTVSSQPATNALHGTTRQPLQLLLREIQVPLFSILAFILAGSALALTLLYRSLIRPMAQMTLTARRIIDGNLDISMPRYSCQEVNDLGRSFNDLSSNLQEVILLVWNHIHESSRTLEHMIEHEQEGQEQIPSPIQRDLKVIREKMKTIEQVITSFDLYDVQIRDQRALAGPNTWQGGTRQPAGSTAPEDRRN